MDRSLTSFEADAMSTLLAGDHPVLEVLRGQLAVASVSKREFTGVGFFTTLELPGATVRAPLSHRIVLSDAAAEISGLSHGAGLALFVDNGVLDTLEGFTYDEPWPDEIDAYSISGVHRPGGAPTDLEKIELAWKRT